MLAHLLVLQVAARGTGTVGDTVVVLDKSPSSRREIPKVVFYLLEVGSLRKACTNSTKGASSPPSYSKAPRRKPWKSSRWHPRSVSLSLLFGTKQVFP